MAKLKNSPRRGLKLVEATREEREQLGKLLEGHPWQLTLKDFLARVCSEYGYSLHEQGVVDPRGQPVKLPYLKNPDGRVVHLPGNLGENDTLDEFVTGSLCRRLKIPPEDWGLMPEEPYDESSDDWET
jgi:hypothetical protein